MPETLSTEEELRDYFLYTKNIKKWSRSTSTIAICGIKFFYENTLKRDWTTLTFVRYATHLLEAGVNLKLIQIWLGHNTPTTTSIYTHLTTTATF
ncbi:MAG: tyrosine-type recombinase/integrase [Desulfobacterales bacterium]|nr:tyrosine-type recombinase/integrase [Desulfobacterales bacterium]